MRKILKIFLCFAFSVSACANESYAGLPLWLSKMIAEQKDKKYPDEIEEVVYEGKKAFEIIHTDRFDSGDEHVLMSADGRKICTFGGYVGRVSSGECDIDEIEYVRTVFQPKRITP